MAFEFAKREDDDAPMTLSEAVGQSLGAASMCWEDMSGTGTFQSDRAKEIYDALMDFIDTNFDVLPKRTAVPSGEEIAARSRWRRVDPQGRTVE